MKKINLLIAPAAAAAFFATSESAYAIGDIWAVPVTGQTWGTPGAGGNTVLAVDLSAFYTGGLMITGVGWDYTVTTLGASWVSESTFLFSDNYGDTNYVFAGSSAQPSPGVGNNSSGGVLKLANYNIPDIAVPDSIINVEFFETFDDGGSGQQDSNFHGTIYLQVVGVPAPGALALLGAAGLVTRRRRRA